MASMYIVRVMYSGKNTISMSNEHIRVAEKLGAEINEDVTYGDGSGFGTEFFFNDRDIAMLFRNGTANGNTAVGFTEVRS